MNEENTQGQTTDNSGDGNKSGETSLIEQGNAAAKRMEDAVQKVREEREKLEALEVRRMLAGRSQGTPLPPPKEETPQEYYQKVRHGKANPFKVQQ